jgi:hypothetical protein
MVEMAQIAFRGRSNSAGCNLGDLPAVTEGLAPGEQHTIAVAITVMC